MYIHIMMFESLNFLFRIRIKSNFEIFKLLSQVYIYILDN